MDDTSEYVDGFLFEGYKSSGSTEDTYVGEYGYQLSKITTFSFWGNDIERIILTFEKAGNSDIELDHGRTKVIG